MSRQEARKKALSLYDSNDLFNQFYIDKANFQPFAVKSFGFYYYEVTLLELVDNPMFLGRIDNSNINIKMSEIALHKDINSIKFVPIDLLGELYICFDAKYKKSKDKKRDSIIIDAILGKIEALGMSLQEIDCYGASAKRKLIGRGSRCYQFNVNYIKDKDKFKVLKNSSSIFNGMSYDEVLITLGNNGMLLKELGVESINEKLCEVALRETPKALKYVPNHYFDVCVKSYTRQPTLSSGFKDALKK